MRVVGIIQARMGSTRFPGKMMALLAGRPLLWHIITRMRQAVTLDELVLATTVESGDDMLAAFADRLGLSVVRGSEENVLGRFVQAAEETRADVIVRINGDAPLVDPPFTDKLVTTLISEEADYVQALPGTPCFHDGVDPMSRYILDRMAAEVPDEPMAREHVSGYLKRHPEFGRHAHVAVDHMLQVAGPRLSIDTHEDLAFFESLYRRFGAPPGYLDLRAVASGFASGALRQAGWGG